jgi:hypothetical protein
VRKKGRNFTKQMQTSGVIKKYQKSRRAWEGNIEQKKHAPAIWRG